MKELMNKRRQTGKAGSYPESQFMSQMEGKGVKIQNLSNPFSNKEMA